MIQGFKAIPGPLQKQILVRLGLGLLFLVLLVTISCTMPDIYLCIPCAGMVVYYLISAFMLFRRAVLGEYVIVSGECLETALTTIKRRVKYVVLDTEACKLKVILHNRLRKIPDGAAISMYIAKNTQVYEQNGTQVLYNYIAIEVK